MYPVGLQVMAGMEAAQQQKGPRQTLTVPEVVDAAREPLRAFLDKHANARERAFFVDAARRMVGATGAQAVGPKDFVVLVPAFLVSEITEAFVIGVLLALPFVVVDLVVANVLMALGMQMMPPTTVALPLKLLLLVVLDGWSRLAHALVLNYR
jgi:type III secretion protein R